MPALTPSFFDRATQAYFISDDAPVEYFKFASQFGRKFGHTFRIIPHYVATVLAHIVEFLARLTEYVNVLHHHSLSSHRLLVGIKLTFSLSLGFPDDDDNAEVDDCHWVS